VVVASLEDFLQPFVVRVQVGYLLEVAIPEGKLQGKKKIPITIR